MHMGGVDLCDMLMALYRIHLRGTKYYMHIVYYCIHLAVVNGWLLYRRHCTQMSIPDKDHMSLLRFQNTISTSLILATERLKPQRGRPSITPPARKKTRPAAVMPVHDVRFDGTDHLPGFAEKKQRCRYCTSGYSFVLCQKCNVQLCLVKGRNCFSDFHKK